MQAGYTLRIEGQVSEGDSRAGHRRGDCDQTLLEPGVGPEIDLGGGVRGAEH